MNLRVLRAKAEFVLTGEARGGRCPECDIGESVAITEDGIDCEECGFHKDLPEAPSWL